MVCPATVKYSSIEWLSLIILGTPRNCNFKLAFKIPNLAGLNKNDMKTYYSLDRFYITVL